MTNKDLNPVFLSCGKGLQYLLEKEVASLGGVQTKPVPAGVFAHATRRDCYRMLLWSRVANRLVWTLFEGKAATAESIYELCVRYDWQQHFSAEQTISIHFSGTNEAIRNSTFGAMKVKDAIVDYFRNQNGERPNIDRKNADIQITVRLAKGSISVGLDLSGESLHRRHYRKDTGPAPLKENLAAGILLMAGWPDSYEADAGLIDPMCGSGTFLIEAAQLATDYAPGLRREKWGFEQWRKHSPSDWDQIVQEARERSIAGRERYQGKIVGFDLDSKVVSAAWENIRQSGFDDLIHVEKRTLDNFDCFAGLKAGLLVTNPPYGERLGELKQLQGLYVKLGQVFSQFLVGWKAAVLTGNKDLGRKISWRSHKQYQLFNGAIESQCLLFDLKSENQFAELWQSASERLSNPNLWKIKNAERASMLRNRLKKNLKGLKKWRERNEIKAYRGYDADIPEFAFALDLYEDSEGRSWAHVQEYAPPASINEEKAAERLSEALAVICEVLSLPPKQVILKSRLAQKGKKQYEKLSHKKQYVRVQEGAALMLVNFWDYLDTGLFLDHRAARRWVYENAKGKRVLNLFCYTASASVQAALGGAKSSLSLDMSNTYLEWAKRNFDLNALDGSRHALRRANCIEWLEGDEEEQRFDLIFLDPPSFSNSKSMEGVLDIQRDHAQMVHNCMKRLSPEGVLLFSNNFRKFKLDNELAEKYLVENWHKPSLDKDFEKNPKIHGTWLIRHQK